MIASLERRFARLERWRAEVSAELAALTPAQLEFRPAAEAWTVGEVVDHVARVERSVLEGARKPGVNRTNWRRRPHRRLLTWLAFRAGLRIKVPERVKHVTPQHGAAAGEALARWAQVREEMRTFLASLRLEELDRLAIKHPLAGPFSYRTFLAFLEWHLRHHRRQLKRIVTAPAFPQR